MVTDLQAKKASFSSLAFRIRVDNLDFFRGKTLSKVFSVGTGADNKPVLEFSKMEIPEEIKNKLKAAFGQIFG